MVGGIYLAHRNKMPLNASAQNHRKEMLFNIGILLNKYLLAVYPVPIKL